MASYKVYIENEAKVEVRSLPGHVRRRVSQAVRALADEARPPGSRPLAVEGFAAEVRRLRIDRWRVIYTVDSEWNEIVVYAVRKRPPYDYGDLASLLKAAG
jgi:mRNA interferase RelE/StbE